MNWGNGIDTFMVIQVGELDEEKELFNFDLIVLAVEVDDLFVEGFGNANSGAACGEDVVEECQIEGVPFGLASSNVTKTIEDMVGAIFFLNGHVMEVAFTEGQLAFLADRDDVLHQLGLGQQRRSKQETTGFYRDDIGAMGMSVNVGYKLSICFLVGEKRDNVDKIDARLRRKLRKSRLQRKPLPKKLIKNNFQY